jgi:hypothetical protein
MSAGIVPAYVRENCATRRTGEFGQDVPTLGSRVAQDLREIEMNLPRVIRQCVSVVKPHARGEFKPPRSRQTKSPICPLSTEPDGQLRHRRYLFWLRRRPHIDVSVHSGSSREVIAGVLLWVMTRRSMTVAGHTRERSGRRRLCVATVLVVVVPLALVVLV